MFSALMLLSLAQVPIGPMPRPVLEVTSDRDTADKCEWQVRAPVNAPDVRALYCVKGTTVIGAYFNGKYFPYGGKGPDDWGKPTTPPIPMDEQSAKLLLDCGGVPRVVGKELIPNFGVTDNINKVESPGKVEASGGLPNDLGKWRLTIRSDDKNLIESVRQAVKPWAEHILVQAYPPGHWALEPGLDFGIVHLEKPPRADGKAELVCTIRDAENIAPRVATVLRKADPTFNANAVPDTSKSGGLDDVLAWLKSPGPGGIPWGIVIGVGVFVWLQLKKSQKL